MSIGNDSVFSVSDFVAVFNQTLEYAYPSVIIEGELANFRISKNRWVYFDLKDNDASVKFFSTVYQLPGPLEDGLMLQVSAVPRLHPLYGFSMNVQTMKPVGEGSLVRAAALLEVKLRTEGLFDESRKRPLPYPPKRIGLITSSESAAFQDFMKIINERWGGMEIMLADVQVQGEVAPKQIISALDYFNTHENPVDLIVMTRGGGSAEDLSAFNHEQLTRAVATSRVPTLVAIGHEVNVSLAELAADKRASTPSNAAEVLVPDKKHELSRLGILVRNLTEQVNVSYEQRRLSLERLTVDMGGLIKSVLQSVNYNLDLKYKMLETLSPTATLARGYSVIRTNGKVVSSVKSLKTGDEIEIMLHDGFADASISGTKS